MQNETLQLPTGTITETKVVKTLMKHDSCHLCVIILHTKKKLHYLCLHFNGCDIYFLGFFFLLRFRRTDRHHETTSGGRVQRQDRPGRRSDYSRSRSAGGDESEINENHRRESLNCALRRSKHVKLVDLEVRENESRGKRIGFAFLKAVSRSNRRYTHSSKSSLRSHKLRKKNSLTQKTVVISSRETCIPQAIK